jgi:hypothetical protein
MGKRVISLATQLRRLHGITTTGNKNFARFVVPTLSFAWKGHTDCSNIIKITAFTAEEDILLIIGTHLFKEKELVNLYTDPYFVYNGIRYTIQSGIITNLILCNIYDL